MNSPAKHELLSDAASQSLFVLGFCKIETQKRRLAKFQKKKKRKKESGVGGNVVWNKKCMVEFTVGLFVSVYSF